MFFKIKPGKKGIPDKIEIGAKGFGITAGPSGGSVQVPDLRSFIESAPRPLVPAFPGAGLGTDPAPDSAEQSARPPAASPDAGEWRQPRGMWDVRMHMEGVDEDMELVIDANQFTVGNVNALVEAYYRLDAEAIAASLGQFIKYWNLHTEDGRRVSIDANGVLDGDPNVVFGIVTELIRAFGTLAERPECAFRNPDSGVAPVIIRRERLPDGSLGEPVVFDETVLPK